LHNSRRRVFAVAEAPAPVAERRYGIDFLDIFLICIFLTGLYTNYTIMLSAKVPFPSVPSGVAGMFLLWRRRDDITEAAVKCLLAILLILVVSIFCATNWSFLARRLNGLIQITY